MMAKRGEPKVEPEPVLQPPPPPPEPSVAAPAMDMLAMIDQRRARRQAMEEAWRQRQQPPPNAPPDAASRNLETLTGRDGVSGVFTILRKGTRTGEFAFNGWRQEARGWREVIEVDAGQGGNLELAMVRKMISLIRTHYTGDFNWESHRLQRVVVLSARPEDTAGLEEFMMREFFGAQVLKARP